MLKSTIAVVALLAATPAFAQDADCPTPTTKRHVHASAPASAYIPDYEGSDDYEMIPAVVVRGRLSGFNFFTRGDLSLCRCHRAATAALEFDFGPDRRRSP